MFDRHAHSKAAFYYGCWEQGLHRCYGKKECGSDKKGEAFERVITIPDVLPDGDYVLSLIWYGGLEYTRQKGKFSDYTSCAFVRIQGGYRMRWRFTPYFDAGDTGEYKHGDECLTSATYAGQCTAGCDKTQAYYAKPYPFRFGGKSKPLRREDFA